MTKNRTEFDPWFPVDMFIDLYRSKGDWGTQSKRLDAVCKFEIGRSQFGFALDEIASHRIGTTIESELRQAFIGRNISKAGIQEYNDALDAQLEWVDETLANCERAIKYIYQG